MKECLSCITMSAPCLGRVRNPHAQTSYPFLVVMKIGSAESCLHRTQHVLFVSSAVGNDGEMEWTRSARQKAATTGVFEWFLSL